MGFFWSGCHADLGGTLEILQHPAPPTLLLGRTPVALVYYDEVEEFRLEELLEMRNIVIAHHLLVEGKVNLIGGNLGGGVLGKIHLMDYLLQRLEVLKNRLVNQNVSVSQVEDFPLQVALEQTVNYLKGRKCLACTRGHDKKEPLLSPGYGIQGAVNGHLLIITGRILASIEGLIDDFDFFRGKLVFCIQLFVGPWFGEIL